MNKPRALIRSKKLEGRVATCSLNFNQLKAIYGTRMVAVDREFIYVGREDEPEYIRNNSIIQDLFRKHPKVFFGYCCIDLLDRNLSPTTVLTAQGQTFNKSPIMSGQFKNFYQLNPIVAPAINLHATMPIGMIHKSRTSSRMYHGENRLIYIGGKTEKEVLSVLDRAERFNFMK